jgi:hypothetical protein
MATQEPSRERVLRQIFRRQAHRCSLYSFEQGLSSAFATAHDGGVLQPPEKVDTMDTGPFGRGPRRQFRRSQQRHEPVAGDAGEQGDGHPRARALPHFVRHFAVLFDAPIDGACGLEIANLALPIAGRQARVYRVDCQLGRLGELKVSDVTL